MMMVRMSAVPLSISLDTRKLADVMQDDATRSGFLITHSWERIATYD